MASLRERKRALELYGEGKIEDAEKITKKKKKAPKAGGGAVVRTVGMARRGLGN